MGLPLGRTRLRSLLAATYAGGLLVFAVLLLVWGLSPRWQHYYISQMKDAGAAGTVLMALLLGLQLVSLAAAALRGPTPALWLRAALAALVLVLLLTDSASSVHIAAFLASMILAVALSGHSAIDLFARGHLALAIAVLALLGLLAIWTDAWGPTWQKTMVLLFVAVEALHLLVPAPPAPPRRLRPAPAVVLARRRPPRSLPP